jgi:phosphonate transport system ATP-binding protein
MSLVALDRESFGFDGKAVLHDISLTIAPGERIALLGRSGAGKSTLIGVLYRKLAEVEAPVALVPQEQALVPTLSVFHNIYIGQLDRRSTLYNLANLVRPWPGEVAAVGATAAPLALDDLLMRKVETLSGGQKQRAAVARALFRGGTILLADEPVSAVDEVQSRRVLELLCRRFSTVIVALHDVLLARDIATRVIGLRQGRVTLDCRVDAIDRDRLDALYAH